MSCGILSLGELYALGLVKASCTHRRLIRTVLRPRLGTRHLPLLPCRNRWWR